MAVDPKDTAAKVVVSSEHSKRSHKWVRAKPADKDRHDAISTTVHTPEDFHDREDEDDDGFATSIATAAATATIDGELSSDTLPEEAGPESLVDDLEDTDEGD